jgi:hypothetical protein
VQAHHLQIGEKDFLDLVSERLEVFKRGNKAHEAAGKEQ